jgi:small-conductance mechanosensitive channel
VGILKFDRLFAVAIGFGVIILAAKGIHRISQKLQSGYPTKRVFFLQIATVLNFALYIGGGTLLVYAVLQPPKEILIAIAGSAAVAIGISLKDIVASIVAGIVLLFDRPFQVGDRVSFADTYGEIVGIGLRTVKLITLDDNLVTIPNSRFLTDVVASGNAGALDMMVVFDFHVSLDEDIDKIRDLVHEVVATSRFTYRKKPIFVLLSEVSIAERLALRVRAKAYVIDCRFEKAFETDVVTRVLKLFAKKGIQRPTRV